MRKLTFAAYLLLFSSLFINATCNKDNRPCEDVMCTMIFASVTAQVVTPDNQAVQLDEVYTLRKSTGDKIRLTQQMAEGRYNIIDDNYQRTIQNTSETFELVGIKDGKQVVSELYLISADCCHVKKE